jgi:hypothetical protein
VGGQTIPQTATEGGHAPIDAGTNARIGMPVPGNAPRAAAAPPPGPAETPWMGAIPAGLGLPSVVRIPIPGTNGLAIEFAPRGRVPATGSTSTLFFQDVSGKRHLRLDYGYNVKTKSINYHWNQSGTHANFVIADHTPVGRVGEAVYQAAKVFRYAGRVLLVVGVVVDAVSIVQSDRPLRRASQVVTAWAAAWAGCELVGAGGAALGTLATPIGTAAGGVIGCVIGGAGGYWGGSVVSGEVYDWAEGTRFTPLAEESGP